MMNLREASLNDISAIQQIAFQTWPEVYGSIITELQIEYMLNLFYSEAALQENMVQKKHQFMLIQEQNLPIGFASFEHHYLQQKVTRLHKLYLIPQFHGQGCGKLLMQSVVEKSRENSSRIISLNVNKFNPTLAFYQRIGFEIVGEEKIPIGNDFFMDDYIMELQLH